MGFYNRLVPSSLIALLLAFSSLSAAQKPLPETMQKVMNQPKYAHSFWGLYAQDLQTGDVLFDLHSDQLFSPASTTKIFSVAALLHAYGDDFRFKTPVYAIGKVQDGQLHGNLVLVAQGDLTMGGRQSNPDKISYTTLDHINANEVPGVTLTKEDPLNGLKELAKQLGQKGIKEVQGDVLIDDRLFESTQKRGMSLSPIMINENLIDIVVNPTSIGQTANLTWRPEVPGYTVTNQLKTIAEGEPFAIEVTSDTEGHYILVQGTISMDQRDVVRTFAVKDPNYFARAALIAVLRDQGIKVSLPAEKSVPLPALNSYRDLLPAALFISPPLSEYAKLILKVSHNLGADLVPLLLAVHQEKKTFDEGMRILGDFVIQEVKLSPNDFVFVDAAGGNENRLTPKAEVQLLTYIHKQSPDQFRHFYDALPILGVDGSLADFAKKTQAVGKVRAKPGTGVAFNLATGNFFLITQSLAGYVEGKNGHLIAYMLSVNNGEMPTINDIFPIFEDVSQLSSMIFNDSDLQEK